MTAEPKLLSEAELETIRIRDRSTGYSRPWTEDAHDRRALLSHIAAERRAHELQLDDAQHELASVRNKLESSRQANERQTAQLDAARQEAERAKGELAARERELATAKSRLDALSTDLATSEARCGARERELERVRRASRKALEQVGLFLSNLKWAMVKSRSLPTGDEINSLHDCVDAVLAIIPQEPPATQPDSPPAFRCPRCGGTTLDWDSEEELATREPLICKDCQWVGTWPEVEAAKAQRSEA